MIRATIVKEIQRLLADRGALVATFALPLAFIVVFGLMFQGAGAGGGGGSAQPVAFWSAEPSDLAKRIAAEIEGGDFFRLRRAQSAAQVRHLVASEEVPVGLVLPAGFRVDGQERGEIVIDEGQDLRVRGPLEGGLRGIVAKAWFGAKYGSVAGVQQEMNRSILATRTPPGIKKPLENLNSFHVAVPGNAVLFVFFLSMTVALSFVEERRLGTWRRLLAAPVSRRVILIAKLLPYGLVGLVQMAFLFGAAMLFFGMPVAGSFAALAAVTVAVVSAALGLGFFIASLGGSEKQVSSYSTIAILVLALVGGCMMPRLFMPPAMRTIGLITPHAWALDGFYDALIRSGTGLADVATEVLVLFGFGALFTALGALFFRFER